MRVALIFFGVLVAFGVVACSGPDDAEPREPMLRDGVDVLDPSEVTRPTLRATQMVRVAPRQRPQHPAPPETAGRLAHLADTTWRAGEFLFVFEPGGHLIVQGGHFDELAEAGVPGRVTNRGGVLTFEILGRTTYGTWDGTSLTIENVEAMRLDPELARSETLLH